MTDEPRQPPRPGPDWISTVDVVEDAEASAELARRWPLLPAERAILVTDLIDPRKAYWRLRVSLPVTSRARARMERGVRLHAALGDVLGPGVPLEVSVRRDGIVARIDAFGEVPLELKTGSRAVPADGVLDQRPDSIGQLAAYCALTDRERGLLVHVGGSPGEPLDVGVAEVEFAPPSENLDRVRRVAEGLRAAVRAGDPSGLAPCHWRGRGCEFEEAKVCSCTGEEAAAPSALLDSVRAVRRRADLEEAYRERFNAMPIEESSPIRNFDSVVFPRSAYFETARPTPPSPPVATPGAGLTPDLFERLVASVETGPIGETRRAIPRAEGAPEMIALWRDQPYLLRTSRSYFRPQASEVRTTQTQYAMQLGFRCVALGAPEGRLVLGWDRAPEGEVPVRVFRYRFRTPGVFAKMWRERTRALTETVADGRFERLAPCPAWKAKNCPYQPECACPGSRDSR